MVSDAAPSHEPSSSSGNRKKTLVACSAILLLAVLVTISIFTTEPTAIRGGATKQTAMLVEVIRVERGDYHPDIVATGTVQPAEDILLSPRVVGKVMARAAEFVPGGFVDKGEVLLRVDPADYQNTLMQRRGDLSQSLSELHLEMGRQSVARQEYEQLFAGTEASEPLSAEGKALVLREPQLAAAQTRVEAARAALAQAQLDLERTTLRAPFPAHVLSREVDVGSQVSPGVTLGRLVGIETYWVVAAVPLSKRAWLSFPDASKKVSGSEVRVQNPATWPKEAYRSGQLFKLIGALDDRTRMARVLVAVPDPLAKLSATPKTGPPLMIGEFVETRIRGKQVKDVARLNRDYVRKNDTAWVMNSGKLNIRKLEIIVSDDSYVYVSSGLEAGEQIVTSNLSTVTEGAALRVEGSKQKP